MNLKMTPEIRNVLQHHPAGLIPLEDDSSSEAVFLVRLSDIPDLQSKIDDRIRQHLAEADADIVAGNVAPWNVEDIKRRGQERQNHSSDVD
ncbi:MAG: hypothetical protein ACYC6Y_24575 [Thermoguttaceae bacterium]